MTNTFFFTNYITNLLFGIDYRFIGLDLSIVHLICAYLKYLQLYEL